MMFKHRFSHDTRIVLNRSYQILTRFRQVIPVYPTVERKCSPNILTQLSETDIKTLDPTGVKKKLVQKSNPDRVKAGDIVRIVYDSSKCNYNSFIGYVLSVDRKQLIQDSSLLLRNRIAKTPVEMRTPVFSPLIERIDLLRRADGKRKRNKHYYIRGTKLDVNDIEASMKKRK